MKTVLLFTAFSFFLSGYSQIGINTTNPRPSTVLDVRSTNNNTNFGGFMPPKVTLAQRNLIGPLTIEDDGLMVYVVDGPNKQLQMYDGDTGVWRGIHPLNDIKYSAVFAGWDMDGLTTWAPNPFPPSTTEASLNVSGLTRGNGVTTSGSPAADAWGGNGFNAPDKPSAITAGDFVSFTVTPGFGVTGSLTTIEPFNTRRSDTGPTQGSWQYSIDGGTTFTDIITLVWGTGTAGTGAAGASHAAINLSNLLDLQGLTSSTTVIFRIVSWGASAAGGNWYFNRQSAGNDLIIRGNIR